MLKTESFEMKRESRIEKRHERKEEKNRIQNSLFVRQQALFFSFVPRSTCFYTGMGDPEANLVKFRKNFNVSFLGLGQAPEFQAWQ